MATTTNFGWETPDDTDLVKDGALAMRTLGNSIDTSFVDLKGGTTGQILSKASNTDLDYTWINNDQGDITAVTAGTGLTGGGTTGAVTVSLDSPVAATLGGTAQTTYATGDLLYASGTNTLAKRAVGTTGQVLTVSGGVPTWAAPAGGGKVLQVLSTIKSNTFTTTSSTATDVTDLSVTITPSATTSKILVHYNLALYNYTGVGISFMNLVRGSTALSQGTADGSRIVATGGIDGTNTYGPQPAIAGNFLDSPSTTSATTYKIQVWAPNGTQTSVNRSYEDSNQSNRPRFASVITVMEIGA